MADTTSVVDTFKAEHEKEYNYVFKTRPFEHQMQAYLRYRDKNMIALFFDMGTGKTKTIIDLVVSRYLRRQLDALIVIAPNLVHTQWAQSELPIHANVEYNRLVWKSSKVSQKGYGWKLEQFVNKVPNPRSLQVFCINVEAFQSDKVLAYVDKFIKTYDGKVMLCMDEATTIKNPKAKRTKAIIKLRDKVTARAILTGTPVAKSPLSVWSMFEFLQENYFGYGYFIFERAYSVQVQDYNPMSRRRFNRLMDEKEWNIIRYNIKKLRDDAIRRFPEMSEEQVKRKVCTEVELINNVSNSVARHIYEHEKYTKYRNMDKLKALMDKVAMSVKAEDCQDLPPKVYKPVYVDMSASQRKAYEELKIELRAMYEGAELTVTNRMVIVLRQMQICGGFFPFIDNTGEEKVTGAVRIKDATDKLDYIVSQMEEIDFERHKCIIWAAFVPEILMLHEALQNAGYNSALFYGAVSQDSRDKTVTEFQAGNIDILVANVMTMGKGLNLQKAPIQFFYSNNYRIEDRLQAEKRSHRFGVTADKVVFTDLIIKRSIEEKIYSAIREGRDLNDYFTSAPLDALLSDETTETNTEDDE